MITEFYQPEVTVISLVRFICAKYEAFAKWDRRTLVHWLLHNMEQGFVIPISSDGLTLDCLVIARPIMDPLDAFEHYKFDYEGPIIYVELAISTNKEGLRALTIALIHRFGTRQSVCWHRHNNNKLIVLPAARVVNRILKKVTHGQA